LPLPCPFENCLVICRGPISILLCVARRSFRNLARSLTLRRRHIRGAPHWVDICIDCLKRTSIHLTLGCHKICASPACPNKAGEYHISTYGCVEQRNDEVTIIKYGLVCEELGLANRCRWYSIMMNV
jgi:hypothetical protein